MNQQSQKLLGLQRAEFDKASRLQIAIVFVQLAIAILASITVFLSNELAVYSLSIATVIFAVLWLLLAQKLRRVRSRAERARRITVLMDAFGEPLSPYEYKDLLVGFSATPEQAIAREDPDYYASTEMPGLLRLRGMLEETAFWSKYLLEKSAHVYKVALFVTGSLLVIVLLGSETFLSKEGFNSIVKAVLAISTALVSVDVVGAALAYSMAAREVATVLTKTQMTDVSGQQAIQSLMILFSDYNSAVENAPLLAPGVYTQNRDKLNRLWSQR